MNLKEELDLLIEKGATQDSAFKFFDKLEPVQIEEVIGSWKGTEVPSDHPLDGLLSEGNWYGKNFVSEEKVYPLVFEKPNGDLFYVNPRKLFDEMKISQEILESAETDEDLARIRMLEYRGKVSATMLYDQLPINDILRRVDENTLFGLMDFKGPLHNLGYFFILKK